MRKIEHFEVSGKRVVKRVDINSPIDEKGNIVINPRIRRHAQSIKELSDRGAKVIVTAHQGRKGDKDFLSLEKHAGMIANLTGKDVRFVPGTDEARVEKEIAGMKPGDILVLENTRMWKNEEDNIHENPLTRVLAKNSDIYLLDAMSVAHREHASVVGLTKYVKSGVGFVLRNELTALQKMEGGQVLLIIGGGKAKDSIKIMKTWLASGKASKVLLGGTVSVLFIYADGYRNEASKKYLEEEELMAFIPEAKELLEKYRDRIFVPEDVALNVEGKRVESRVDALGEGPIFDIGEETIEKYSEEIFNTKKILINGPMGVYEMPQFETGTRKILEAIAESEAFSLVGGGHTISAIEKFKIPEDKFGYVSLSGKALIQYLSGKELPALKALKESSSK
ncbi:phosphoglycerate kinase [Candidatus Micrarchaeota archaeon]|nr:phosphoglycerate kinase [Candidatus Micrarchaeota archaeon]